MKPTKLLKPHRWHCLAPFLLLAACGGSGGSAGGGMASAVHPGPALSVAQQKLEQSLHCTPFTNPDKPVVLLVHGTFTNGAEQYRVFYTPQLVDQGFDVCFVTYPDRGLGDQQESAEYVVHAVRRIHAMTGRMVDMIGHSQGATMPRWAIKFWPDVRSVIDDFVLIAGPNHGLSAASLGELSMIFAGLPGASSVPAGLPAAFFQFSPDSKFVSVLNAGDETPGDIDYTTLYTTFDELIQPAPIQKGTGATLTGGAPTAALDWKAGKPHPNQHVANLWLQSADLCPGHVSDHVTIGTTDTLAFALALDAISHPGPANFERAGGQALCAARSIDLQSLLQPQRVQDLLAILQNDVQAGIPQAHLVTQEPPLKPYAQGLLGR